MKRIKAYKTTDSKIFDDREEAEAHQNKLDRERMIELFISNHCFSAMTVRDFRDLLVEHGGELGV